MNQDIRISFVKNKNPQLVMQNIKVLNKYYKVLNFSTSIAKYQIFAISIVIHCEPYCKI